MKKLKKMSKKELRTVIKDMDTRNIELIGKVNEYHAESVGHRVQVDQMQDLLDEAVQTAHALDQHRMMLVAWRLDGYGEQTTARLTEQAEWTEEAVRQGKIALPVDIDTLPGSVLP